jgi:putative spermidine/putrescine transport system permease protein
MILPLYSVLTRIDPSYSNAAASLGAAPVRNFLHVYLPLSLPGAGQHRPGVRRRPRLLHHSLLGGPAIP